MLLEDRLQEILAQARKDLPDIPRPREAAEKQIASFETNSSRMTYSTFGSQSLSSSTTLTSSENGSKTPACSGPSRGRGTSSTSERSFSATDLTTSGLPEIRKPPTFRNFGVVHPRRCGSKNCLAPRAGRSYVHTLNERTR